MKTKLLFALIFCVFSLLESHSQSRFDYYVAAPAGLSLREEPNQKSKRLELIPYGTELTSISFAHVYPAQFGIDTIDGYESSWIEVQYNEKSGYVFAGYVLPVSPPAELDKTLKNYLTRIFGQPVYRDSFPNTYKFDNDGIYGINYRDLYKTGEIFLTASMEEAWEYSLTDINLGFSQAYLWFYLMEQKLIEGQHVLPKINYPLKDVYNDSLSIKHGKDFHFWQGDELDVRLVDWSTYTQYVRFIGQNGRITIIWGGHL